MEITKKLQEQQVWNDEGAWLSIGDGAEIKIRHTQNVKTKDKFRRLERQYRQQNGIRANKELAPEVVEELMRKAFVGTVVLDWKGITEKGKEIPYSDEKCEWMLLNLHDFTEAVLGVAGDKANFRAENLEVVSGN